MDETITVEVHFDDLIDANNALPEDRDLCPQYILITALNSKKEIIQTKVKWEDVIDEYNKLPRDRQECPVFIKMQAKPLFNGMLVRGSKTKGRRVKAAK